MATHAAGANAGSPAPDSSTDDEFFAAAPEGNAGEGGEEKVEPSTTEKPTPPADGGKTSEGAAPELLPKHQERLALMAGETPAASTDKSKAKEKQAGKPAAPAKGGEPAKAGEKPKTDAAAKPGDANAKPGEKAAADPYSTDIEKTLQGDAKGAFIRGRVELKKARDQVAALTAEKTRIEAEKGQVTELADFGGSIQKLLETHDIVEAFNDCSDEQIAEVIKTQDALNRVGTNWSKRQMPHPADVAELEATHAKFTATLRSFGIKVDGGDAGGASVKPFEGDLPDDLVELVQLGHDEKRVRMLHALELAEKAGPPKAKQPAADQRPPVQQQRQPVQQQRQPISQAAQVQQQVETRTAARKLTGFLTGKGVKPEKVPNFIKGIILPACFADLPTIQGMQPAQVWQTLSLSQRHDLMVEATEAYIAKRANPQVNGGGAAGQANGNGQRKLVAPPRTLTQRSVGTQMRGRTTNQTTRPGGNILAHMAGEAEEGE